MAVMFGWSWTKVSDLGNQVFGQASMEGGLISNDKTFKCVLCKGNFKKRLHGKPCYDKTIAAANGQINCNETTDKWPAIE